MRIIKKFVLGEIEVSTFLLEHNNMHILIDCGKTDDAFFEFLKNESIDLKYIFLTHTHFDHIEGINAVKNIFPNVKVVVAKEEKQFLNDPENNLSNYFNYQVKIDYNAITYDDITIEGITFKEIRGHSKQSMVIIFEKEKTIFSGDSVFKNGVGRSDFYYGDHKSLILDIKRNIFCYDDDFIIYPGHGAKTSIKNEKNNDVYRG